MAQKKLQLSILLLLTLGFTGIYAQTIYIKQDNDTQAAFTFDKIQKMKFSSTEVTIQTSNNTQKSYVLDSIRYLNYKDLTPNGTFTDPRDGNVYKWVRIGEQVWMAENLRYLPKVNNPQTFTDTMRCYYVYGYNGVDTSKAKLAANYKTYGVLYNWPAAMANEAGSSANPSGVQGTCPTGWHLPSDEEWWQLTNYLTGNPKKINYYPPAGGKLKENDTTHWETPNTGATNQTKFTALPGGYLYIPGTFQNIRYFGYWWTTTESPDASNFVWYRSMSSYYIYVNSMNAYHKSAGLSVRCIKD